MEMKHIQDIMNDCLYNMRKSWGVFKDCVYAVYLSAYAHAVVISKLQRNVKDLDVRVTEVTNGTYDITVTFDNTRCHCAHEEAARTHRHDDQTYRCIGQERDGHCSDVSDQRSKKRHKNDHIRDRTFWVSTDQTRR